MNQRNLADNLDEGEFESADGASGNESDFSAIHRSLLERSRGCWRSLNVGLAAWGCLQAGSLIASVFESQTYDLFDGLQSLVIPDGSSAGISDTRTFSIAAHELTVLSVTLNISAQFNGDIYGYLVHDDRIAVLFNRAGSTSSDRFGYGDTGFQVTLTDAPSDQDIHTYRSTVTPNAGSPLTGSWQPDGRLADPDVVTGSDLRLGTLSVFTGCNPNGDWTLYLADLSAGASSSLDSWQLDVTAIPEPSTTMGLAGMGLLVFAWWRRRQQLSAGRSSSQALHPADLLRAPSQGSASRAATGYWAIRLAARDVLPNPDRFMVPVRSNNEIPLSMKSRRSFICKTASAMAALSAAPTLVAATTTRSWRSTTRMNPAALNYAAFSQMTGTQFQVRDSQGTVHSLALGQATQCTTQPGLENFSLVFLGAARTALPQGTYRFIHSRLGTFDMFVVTKPYDDSCVCYEAVFNRLV
jgi:hypothetical protein